MLTQEVLKQLLHYHADTGVFTWLVDRMRGKGAGYVYTKAGSVAGGPHPDGYRQVRIGESKYLLHRLAYLYMTGGWPEHDIDHIDLDRSNNRWTNLRPATRTQNMCNKQARADNKTGIKGVVRRENGTYRAQIMVDGEMYRLGTFDTMREAAMSYALAAQELHGEFALVPDFDFIMSLDSLPPLEIAA